MCSERIQMLVRGTKWTARIAMVGKHYTRSVTRWNKACDEILLRLINYINVTQDDRQMCHVGNKIEDCNHGLFQDASFEGDLQDFQVDFWRHSVRFRFSYV